MQKGERRKRERAFLPLGVFFFFCAPLFRKRYFPSKQMVVPYTLDEAVVSKNLEPFIPKCNIAEFTSMLKRTKAIITKHFALSLVLAVESTSENKESFVTSGPPQLHLEIPSRSRITFKRWMNEMQADETKHSCQKGESTYKFKGPNEMQEFDCRFEDQDSRSIRSHLSMEASAFQCYFESKSSM